MRRRVEGFQFKHRRVAKRGGRSVRKWAQPRQAQPRRVRAPSRRSLPLSNTGRGGTKSNHLHNQLAISRAVPERRTHTRLVAICVAAPSAASQCAAEAQSGRAKGRRRPRKGFADVASVSFSLARRAVTLDSSAARYFRSPQRNGEFENLDDSRRQCKIGCRHRSWTAASASVHISLAYLGRSGPRSSGKPRPLVSCTPRPCMAAIVIALRASIQEKSNEVSISGGAPKDTADTTDWQAESMLWHRLD